VSSERVQRCKTADGQDTPQEMTAPSDDTGLSNIVALLPLSLSLQPVSILVPTLGILPVWQARADAWYSKTGIKVVRDC
jgi:hypothetical protein